MSTKTEKKQEAKQVVAPAEGNPKKVEVATADDVKINEPDSTKKVSPEDAVRPEESRTGSPSVEDNTSAKSAEDYRQEKDFKSITDSGVKEIIVDKERLQVVPNELNGEPVFETAAEYQKYLADKSGK